MRANPGSWFSCRDQLLACHIFLLFLNSNLHLSHLESLIYGFHLKISRGYVEASSLLNLLNCPFIHPSPCFDVFIHSPLRPNLSKSLHPSSVLPPCLHAHVSIHLILPLSFFFPSLLFCLPRHSIIRSPSPPHVPSRQYVSEKVIMI